MSMYGCSLSLFVCDFVLEASFLLFVILLHPVDMHSVPDIAASASPGAHANAYANVCSDESKIIIKSVVLGTQWSFARLYPLHCNEVVELYRPKLRRDPAVVLRTQVRLLFPRWY